MQEFETAWGKIMKTPDQPHDKALGSSAPLVERFHVIGGSKRKLAVVLNDIHFPFHDQLVLRQVIRMIADVQPDVIILNGDVVDAYALSSFVKSGKRRVSLLDEINLATAFIESMRNVAPNAELHYTEGNHETRLRRYLDSNSPALAQLPCLSWEHLLKLPEFDVQWHGTEGFKLNRSFLVLHGDRVSKHSGNSARMEFERHLVSGISGHTHRAGRHDVVGHSQEYHWTENGCLCLLKAEYISGRPNWKQAISLVEFNRDRAHTRLHRIENRRLILDGRDYSRSLDQ